MGISAGRQPKPRPVEVVRHDYCELERRSLRCSSSAPAPAAISNAPMPRIGSTEAPVNGNMARGCGAGAVVVGADVLSRFTDPSDRGTAALFGDGAGAGVVLPSGRGGIGPAVFGSDGSRAELIETAREEGVIRMKGPDTYRQAVDRLSEASAQAAERAGVPLEEIDVFAFHQANGRILTAVGERLGLPADRVIDSIHRCGNTSAASIPIALAQAEDAGMLQPGTRVMLSAFGGGLTWGATLVEWGVADAA